MILSRPTPKICLHSVLGPPEGEPGVAAVSQSIHYHYQRSFHIYLHTFITKSTPFSKSYKSPDSTQISFKSWRMDSLGVRTWGARGGRWAVGMPTDVFSRSTKGLFITLSRRLTFGLRIHTGYCGSY